MHISTSNTSTQFDIQPPLDFQHDSPEEWVASLPLANLGETCRLIFNSLTRMRGMDAAAAQRVRTLEALRAPVAYLRDALRPRYLGVAFPLPAKPRKVAHILREIQNEMAQAYQQAITQLLAQNGLRQDVDNLVTALHRALFYHGQSLLTSYELYEEIDGIRWRTLYRLYAEAEHKAMHLSVIKDPLKDGAATTSISNTFKQILLLTLAAPHRLTQHEMNTTYKILHNGAALCQLYPLTNFNAPPGVFILDLNSEDPPGYVIYNSLPHQPSTRMLDTTALGHKLRGLLSQAGQENTQARARGAKDSYSRDLLRRLLHSWGTNSKRAFSRIEHTDEVSVIFGLSAGHEAVARIRAGDPPGAGGVRCQIINESATGARLRWHEEDGARLRVGELIALYHGDKASENLGIGAIRWIKSMPTRGMEFGIQMLVPTATPISLRLADATEAERDYLKGLLTPALPPKETTETVLTPAFIFHAGDIVSVKTGEAEQRLRLTRIIEGTQSYTRFEFASLASLEHPSEEDAEEQVRKKDFDSIWSGL